MKKELLSKKEPEFKDVEDSQSIRIVEDTKDVAEQGLDKEMGVGVTVDSISHPSRNCQLEVKGTEMGCN